jgi:hypothetical protein
MGDSLGGGLKTSSWHLQTASGRLRFLFFHVRSSELVLPFPNKKTAALALRVP